jgi:DNA-binding response OmpR family regulator
MMSDRHSGGTVLVIEDDVGANDLQDRLISFGHSVRLVGSAKDALATFHETDVDLILLSLMLPDSDGLILCSSLTTQTSTPIIVLSERPREVDRLLAAALGASDFLTKPVDFDDLRARIEAVIFDRKKFQPIARLH